jgi:multiple sugar transport system ATP-binding protein
MENNNQVVLSCPKDAYVSLQHIDKVYDNGVQAVFDFNLDIKKHEFIVFVGPSGCGKSTTLRMIAGLENISSGHLFIDGEYVNDVTPKDRNIAMVFQSYALYPHMSVYDNMAYSLKINKVPTKILVKEDQIKIDKIENELNKAFKEFRKVNKERDELQKLASQKENLERDLATVKDSKKAAKFKAQIEKLERKLTNLDEVNAKFNTVDASVDEISDRLAKAKEVAKYEMAIDNARVKDLERQINFAKENNEDKRVKDLTVLLEKVKTTEVPLTKLKHLSKNEINRRVHEAARILQIEEYLDRKPKALSGGQRQRVALGRAIVRHAKVFLMDEPLSNLDAKLRVQMRSEIVRLHNELNATTIYVTHDQTEAMTMATRIVIMKLGHIQQIGTPSEIYRNPANLFVAGFIGSPAMNFFDADYKDGSLSFKNGSKIKLPTNLIQGHDIPSKVIFGIRPEDIHPGDGEHAKEFPDAVVELKVKVAELLGSEYYVHSDFNGKDLIAKMEAVKPINVNETIKVCFNLRKIHLFDPESEKCIF